MPREVEQMGPYTPITTAKLVLLLEKITKGSIIFDGKDIEQLVAADIKVFRKSVQAVFQDPMIRFRKQPHLQKRNTAALIL